MLASNKEYLTPAISLAAEEEVVIHIEGMTCSVCSFGIKKSLNGIEGVIGVFISFKEKTAWVYVEQSVSDEQLIEAIKQAGPYTGEIKERKKQ
jgi:mercuric ion binding protein